MSNHSTRNCEPVARLHFDSDTAESPLHILVPSCLIFVTEHTPCPDALPLTLTLDPCPSFIVSDHFSNCSILLTRKIADTLAKVVESAVHVMENVRQCFHTWPYPMRGRSLLTGGNPGMLPAHFPATLSTCPGLYGIPPNFRLRLRRNVGRRHQFPGRFPQCSATVRTAPHRNRHIHRFHFCLLIRHAPEPKQPLPGFSSRWLRILLALAFGKGGRSAFALQLLDFSAQLLDHPMLIQNDLHQFVAAE